MSDITVEKKLELISQVRSQYNKNQYDMSNRERILYGRSCSDGGEFSKAAKGAETQAISVSGFRVRLLLAVMLLAGVIFFDQSGIKIAGTTMKEFFQVIAADYYPDISAAIAGAEK